MRKMANGYIRLDQSRRGSTPSATSTSSPMKTPSARPAACTTRAPSSTTPRRARHCASHRPPHSQRSPPATRRPAAATRAARAPRCPRPRSAEPPATHPPHTPSPLRLARTSQGGKAMFKPPRGRPRQPYVHYDADSQTASSSVRINQSASVPAQLIYSLGAPERLSLSTPPRARALSRAKAAPAPPPPPASPA